MFGEQFERRVHRDAEMLGDLFDLVIAERCTELIRRYRYIAAIAKPRLNLIAEAALLKLVYEALHIAKVRFRQCRRNKPRRGSFRQLSNHAAEIIE
jgi:hypothetical protein